MALKNIKATELFSTESKFRQLVLASGIGRASAASKSISGKSQLCGYRAEINVVRLLLKRQWLLSFHGFRTPIAEIDLIFEKQNEVLLVEVKTLNNSWISFERIQARQLEKLRQNYILFSRYFSQFRFRVFVAWVDSKNNVSFVEVS